VVGWFQIPCFSAVGLIDFRYIFLSCWLVGWMRWVCVVGCCWKCWRSGSDNGRRVVSFMLSDIKIGFFFQILVPVSMQKETCRTYPLMYEQLNSITSEGVFNMSLSLPEGRVHGGRLQSLLRGGGEQQLKNTETESLSHDFTLGMRSSSSSLSSSIKMRQQQLQQPVNNQKTRIDAYNTVTAPMDNNQVAVVQQRKMMAHSRLEKVDLNRSLGGVDCNVLATCVDLVNGVDLN